MSVWVCGSRRLRTGCGQFTGRVNLWSCQTNPEPRYESVVVDVGMTGLLKSNGMMKRLRGVLKGREVFQMKCR